MDGRLQLVGEKQRRVGNRFRRGLEGRHIGESRLMMIRTVGGEAPHRRFIDDERLLLRDRVAQALAHAVRMQGRVALMYLDLDRFKTINDSLGHPVGDALLREVVERLKSCVRDSDTICRQGGDEFIILLNDVRDSEAVSRIAEKIHLRMTEPVILVKHVLTT